MSFRRSNSVRAFTKPNGRRSLSATAETLEKAIPSSTHSKKPPKPTSKNYCHICRCHFNYSNKKKLCTKCELPVCKAHSGGNLRKDQPRLCDECQKEKLRENSKDPLVKERDYLRKQVEEIVGQKEKYQKVQRDQNHRISTLHRQYEENTQKYRNAENELKEKIKLQRERNQKKVAILEGLREAWQSTMANETNMLERIESAQQGISETQEEICKVENQMETAESELEDLRFFIKNNVPLRLLKNFVCNTCYRKVKYTLGSFLGNIDTSELTPRQTRARKSRKLREDPFKRKVCCVTF